MPLNGYAWLRPCLFALPPEVSHDLTLRALEQLWLQPWFADHVQTWLPNPVHDPVELFGVRFPNRVGLAAGLDKGGRCLPAFASLGFGFVEIGTITPKPQPGNPKPRMFRLPEHQAIINRMGFNSEGLAVVLARLQRYRDRQAQALAAKAPAAMRMPVGVNLGKNASTPLADAANDYIQGLQQAYDLADYFCLNVSSPNTKGLRSLQSDEALTQLLGSIQTSREALAQQHGKRVPVLLKIAPDLDEVQLDVIAKALLHFALDGVIATNTTLARQSVQGSQHAEQTGGLSGAPLTSHATQIIHGLRQRLGPDFPIIGVGGIMQAQHAVEKIQAGANLVQLYSGLIYRGPRLIEECARASADAAKPRREHSERKANGLTYCR